MRKRAKASEPKELSPEAALEKARRFCHYQERYSSEVIQRLKEWSITGEAAQKILHGLCEETLLDDKRFAVAFARGKFRIKGWGTAKIQAGLRAKNIPDALIREALLALPQEDQDNKLQTLLEKKNNLLREPNVQKRKLKLMNYALQKGYRSDAVRKAIDELVRKG